MTRLVDRGAISAAYVGIGMAVTIVVSFMLFIPIEWIIWVLALPSGLLIGYYANQRSDRRLGPWSRIVRNGVFAGLVTGLTTAVLLLGVKSIFFFADNGYPYDITPEQWDQVIAVVKAKNLTPFLDMAYQGFGYGIAEDGAVIQKFVAAGLNFFVSTSFSKSFSLYGERVGGLSVLCQDKEETSRVLSQLKIVIRTNYSNPPIHGGAVVAAVLNNPELRALWESELGAMRVRIKAMRQTLVDGLKAAGVKQDMGFITTQIGMFSYSGLSKDQMVRLRSEFGVYGTDTGRMCVAALNSKNIDYVCKAIAAVI